MGERTKDDPHKHRLRSRLRSQPGLLKEMAACLNYRPLKVQLPYMWHLEAAFASASEQLWSSCHATLQYDGKRSSVTSTHGRALSMGKSGVPGIQ